MTTTIESLSACALALANARGRLADLLTALQSYIDARKAADMPAIRSAADVGATAWLALESEIKANPSLFVKPRTMELHGIKFGMGKGKGGLVIADEERTVKLIEKHLPEQADVLIATTKVPVKDALAQLPADDLKRIGVEVKGTGDRVVISAAKGDMDKIVKALVKEAMEDQP